MISSKRILILPGLILLLSLNGCSGTEDTGTERSEAPVQTPAENRQNIAEIYASAVTFEKQSLAEAEQLASTNRELSSAEKAQIIVVTESAVRNLEQIMETLARNQDPADSRNVISELNQEQWPVQIIKIINALQNKNLDSFEQERIAGIRSALDYAIALSKTLGQNIPPLDIQI